MTRTDLRNASLCAAAVLAAFFLVNPFVELPFNDDFSYAFTVRELLRAGHITFNGWGSPALVPQAYWGLLFVKLFGFSFTALRFSTLPLAMGSAVLCYLLGREAGLRPAYALFASLVLCFSPLFLPLATSFMTDVPGLFCIYLSLYALIRAAQIPKSANPPPIKSKRGSKPRAQIAKTPPLNARRGIVWLIVGILAGFIGGTNRQVVWIVLLSILPYLIWLRRRDALFSAIAAVGWIAIIADGFYMMHWLNQQPYWIPIYSSSDYLQLALSSPLQVIEQLARMGLTTLLFTLPAAIPFCLLALASLWRGQNVVSRRLTILIFAAFTVLFFFPDLGFGLEPWLDNVVTIRGILNPWELSGLRPVGQPESLRIVLSVAVLVVAYIILTFGTEWAIHPRRAARGALWGFLNPTDGRIAMPAMVLFMAGYTALLAPPAVIKMEFDRYCLPLIGCVAIALLLYVQAHLDSERAFRWGMRAAWMALALFSLYGLAATQDLFALARARLVAVHTILAAGHSPRQIAAGLEYDCWTELQIRGHLNNALIVNPPDGFDPQLSLTPDMRCIFRVEFAPQADTRESHFSPVNYLSWLPPFHRRIFIDAYRGPWWLAPEAVDRFAFERFYFPARQ